MPRIEQVTGFAISFEIPAPHRVALGIGRAVKRDAVLVRVEGSDGTVGWGEAHAARAPTAIAELVNSTLRQLVTGLDAGDIDAVWNRVYRMQLASHGAGTAAAIGLSGIDMALWDLRGKLEGQPLYALLGGTRRRIGAYAGGVSLGFQPLPDLLSEIDTVLGQGYRAVKLRLGQSRADDIARVLGVRRHVGSAVDILTDANTAYDLPDVAAIMPVLDDASVGWLEEPFPAHDYRSYAVAATLGDTPLAAGENHYTRFEFERVADDGAIGIWQPDLSKIGGVTEAMRIAHLAAKTGIALHPHTSVTGINMAASVHFLSAIGNGGYFEADCSSYNPFRSELCSGGFLSNGDGTVEALDRPGLGVDVDEGALARFQAIPGAGYV